ncbi:MAG TPA: choice-of-anchor Q domain-containing protein [Puia sp.]|nr:choice-of-anchor Q domain-containing protein [Puia sp.]
MNTFARTYYVNSSAYGANDGSSWTNAFTRLSWAFAAASSGDIIKVAGGTYTASSNTYVDSTFVLPRGITLLGGYPTTGSPSDVQRDWADYPTVLTKSLYSSGLMTATNIDTATVIDGVGLNIGSPALAITNCSNLAIRNTIFTNSDAVTIAGSQPTFTNCVFDGNRGIDAAVDQSAASSSTFYNCVFTRTSNPHTILNQDGAMNLINCAIVANNTTGYTGGASGSATIKNCIFWYNRGSTYSVVADIQPGAQTLIIGNTLTQIYYQDAVTTLLVNEDPRFYNLGNPAGADNKWFTADDGLQLTAPCSPALNAGDNSAVAGLGIDILNRARVFGIVDLGPYEFQGTPTTPMTTVYVNSTATGAGNGSSWQNAFTTMQQALLYCADTIKVAAGVYLTSNSGEDSVFNIQNKTVILGGYPATGSPGDAQRDPIAHQTLLKGNYSPPGFGFTSPVLESFHCDTTTVVDGFTFDNETTVGGGSVASLLIAYESRPRVNNCQFLFVNNDNQGGGGIQVSHYSTPLITHSSFSTDASSISGGAITIDTYSSPTIRYCQFSGITNNGPTYRGTGYAISNQQGAGLVDSCSFIRGSSNAEGPVVQLTGSNMQFTNCYFRSFNSGGNLISGTQNSNGSFTNCVFKNVWSDAISLDNSSPVFTRCLFDSNNLAVTNADYAAPIFNNCVSINGMFLQNTKSAPRVNNSTIINTYNYTYTPNAAQEELITDNDSSTLRANNTIFWGSKLLAGHRDISDTALTSGAQPSTSILTNCLTRNTGTNGVNGNVVGVNPRFSNVSNIYGPDKIMFTADDGITLARCSPAINTGNNGAGTVLSTDILGSPRIYGGTVDMGAYELQQTPLKVFGYYVDAAASGQNNGTSWQDAYTNLQTAVCNVCSDTLRVAAGVYKPALNDPDSSFDFQRDFRLMGGYPTGGATDAQRDPFAHLTILSGDIGRIGDSTDNSTDIITIESVPDSVVIDGFVIRDDYHKVSGIVLGTSSGPPIYMYYSTLNIRNCQFINNHGSLNGGAINFNSGTLNVSKTVFLNNSAADYGGAVAGCCIMHFNDCIFDQNYAYGQGGAIQLWNTFDVKNCLFYHNYTTATTNAAGTGGAIDASQGSGAITNCTFVGNSAAYKYDASGGGIALGGNFGGLGVPIQNCIFWNNSSGGSSTAQGADISYAEYNTVFNSLIQIARYGNNPAGVNPDFIDINNPQGKDGKWFTADDGLQLLYGSPAINFGNNSYISGFPNDLSGGNRIVGASVDAGAYEFQDQPLALAGSDTLICAGDPIRIGQGGDPAFSYSWTSIPAGYSSSNPTPVVHPANTQTYYLSVTDGTTTSTDSVTISTANALTPTVAIYTDTNAVCEGAAVTFNAISTYGGDSATYQWQINGVDASAGSNGPQFSSSTLKDSSTVTAILTSSGSCASPSSVTSNPIELSVGSTAGPYFSFDSLQTAGCIGVDATLRLNDHNGGVNPSFTWDIGYYTYTTKTDTLVAPLPDTLTRVYVSMTTSNSCASTRTYSNGIYFHAVQPIPLSVSISTPDSSICTGTVAVFTATAINGGNTPTYQWLVDGHAVGSDSNTYSSQTLRNGDSITMRLTGSGGCISPSAITSNPIIVTVAPVYSPTVKIVILGPVSTGQPISVRAIAVDGGPAPGFQWQDSTAGSGWNNIIGPTATTATLSYLPPSSGVSVRCILTSSLECVSERTVTSTPLDLSTAISTSDSAASFRYYPNPVLSTLTIDSLQPGAGWYAVEVTGIDGSQPLLTIPITGLSRVTIDMATLPKGIYIVILLRTTGANKYFKVLKI